MSVIRIATNFNIEIEFISPPFYRRLVAWIIDIVILILYGIISIRVFMWLAASSGRDLDSLYDLQWIQRMMWVPFFIYHPLCEITMKGQSIGKKIMGMKVISETGEKASISQLIIRGMIRASDFYLLIFLIMLRFAVMIGPQFYLSFALVLGLLIVDIVLANTRKQQRLGDILAHTIIINTRQNERIEDTIFLDISSQYIPSFPQVMQLSDRDINSLKGILDTARKRHDYNLAEMASDKIRNHLKIESTLSPFDFLEVLLKDYNYLSSN